MSNSLALNRLNALPENDALHVFMQCCTSSKWVERMLNALPVADKTQLVNLANEHWKNLTENDYLEAFEGHPKIGDVNSLRAKYANTKALASGEQSAVDNATETVLTQLAKGNDDYLQKFGFIFIVCATGKSAEEMLTLLQKRLPNNRQTELVNAVEEQRKIFQIRIEKMLEHLEESNDD